MEYKLGNPKGYRFLSAYSKKDNTEVFEYEDFRQLLIDSKLIDSYEINDYKILNNIELDFIAGQLLKKFNINSTENNPITQFFIVYEDYYRFVMQNITHTIKSFNVKITDMNLDFSSISESMTKALKPLIDSLENIKINTKSLLENWNQVIAVFAANFKDFITDYSKAQVIASKYDWVIPLEFELSGSLIHSLIELEDRKQCEKRVIDDLFTEHFTDDVVHEIFENMLCNQRFTSRNAIFSEMKIAFKMELYSILIPVVFAQIEGIIAEGFSHVGKLNGGELKKYIKDLFDRDVDIAIRSIFIDKILINFEHGKEISSEISRHAILHGADFSYGSRINALKLLSILSMLIFSIEMYKIDSINA